MCGYKLVVEVEVEVEEGVSEKLCYYTVKAAVVGRSMDNWPWYRSYYCLAVASADGDRDIIL